MQKGFFQTHVVNGFSDSDLVWDQCLFHIHQVITKLSNFACLPLLSYESFTLIRLSLTPECDLMRMSLTRQSDLIRMSLTRQSDLIRMSLTL